jgi:hypothetical protein
MTNEKEMGWDLQRPWEITKSESADFREGNDLLILPALFVLNRFSSILFDLASRELH